MKRNKGMGMIKLIVMILFIALIVATTVYFVRMQYHKARVETIKTDMLQVQWKMKDYIDKQTVKGDEIEYLGTKLSEMRSSDLLQELFNGNVVTEDEYEKYYVLEDKDLAEAGLEITNYKDSYFIINYETYEIIVSKGCQYYKEEILYKLSDIIGKTNNDENVTVNETNIEE